jgi:SPP1 gp7 family putative phage head morphogenesis protein
MCQVCDIENKYSTEPIHLFTDEEIDMILLAIFAGTVSTHNLDVTTYLKTARKLSEGMFKGYGMTDAEVMYASEDYYMLKALRENIYFFSAAKNYQCTREIEAKMKEMTGTITKDGTIATFSEIKKEAKNIFLEYNENYLRAEYNSAISQSRTASQWQEITKEAKYLPMLTYHTVGDGRVRPTHEVLNNISRPVHDKFWDTYMPPNGWNCRCTVLQSSDAETTSLKDFKHPDDVPDIFKFNAGKERIVFSPKHPYFKVAPQDKNFAKQNFNMPMP